MNVLETLCLALGLSTLAGLRLYLTVFLTSLSLNQGWLKLDPSYASLEVLGGDAILVISGVLLALEFLADKVAGFDSVWDAVHTAIRPIGAGILTLQVLGDWPPEAKVIAGLCAGTVALTVHTAKAGTRLLVNASPEPVSNAVLSTGEDLMVAGMFALLVQHPLVAAIVFLGMIAFSVWVTPRAWRMAKATGRLLVQRLFISPRPGNALPRQLTAEQDMLVSRALGGAHQGIDWAVDTVSTRPRGLRGLDSNRRGILVAFEDRSDALVFVAQRFFRSVPVRLPLDGCRVTQERTFLSENLAIYHPDARRRVVFRFPRAEVAIVERLVADIRARVGSANRTTGSRPSATPADVAVP